MDALRQDDFNNLYQVGAIVYHDEVGSDMTLRLLHNYQEWADVFIQEMIQVLSEHFQFNHKIELLRNLNPPFGTPHSCLTFEIKAIKVLFNNKRIEGRIRKSN